jgi:multidrug transporter EmrE-like cation transporter
MYQVVAATLTAVAMPYAARVLVPVVPVPARYMVSVVIAILTVVALGPAINAMAVPIGYATLPLAGIVIV